MVLILLTLYGVLLTKACCSALSIQQCSPGQKYLYENLYENTPVQLRCGQCSGKIKWFVRVENDQREKYVGECIKLKCDNEDNSAFRLESNMRNKLYSSELDIMNISRPNPLHVSCECYRFYTKHLQRGYHLEDSASCKLITVPISIVPGSCSVQLSGWKVSGVCTVQWLDGQTTPMCKWSLKYKGRPRDIPHLQGQTTSVQRRSTWYKRKNCTIEVDMPVDDGDYTYSVTVPPHPADYFSKTLRIEKPEVPKHNCPEVILEGSSINCTCFTSKIGNPPAHIAWSKSNNEHLVAENVRREESGTVDVCHLSWGVISNETVYTVSVLHGPSGINITSYTRTSGDSTEIVLVCTAIDVYPSAVFVWNITCDNTTDSTNTSKCTLTTASEEVEMIVECIARNSVFENVSLSEIYVVHISGRKESHDTILNGGIVAAVVIVSVIGALIFAYIIKQRLGNEFFGSLVVSALTGVVSSSTAQSPVVHYTAPTDDLYTIAGATIADSGEYEDVTLRDTLENRVDRTESINYHQARAEPLQTKEARKKLKPIKPTRTGASYKNVVELSANHDLSVYHSVTLATMSGYTESETNETTEAVLLNDEYHELHFHEHSPGNEHNDTHYDHLNLK